jgi:hypothetical protein
VRVGHLKLLYTLAGLLWTGYWSVELLAYHIVNRMRISSGTLLCLLLFIAIPVFGYVLLFTLFPYLQRLNTRGRA